MSTSWIRSDLRALPALSPRVHDCIISTADMILASTALMESTSIDKPSVVLESILCRVWLVALLVSLGYL
jgi:hypothetical protein